MITQAIANPSRTNPSRTDPSRTNPSRDREGAVANHLPSSGKSNPSCA
jgi:hypothetical protein